MREPEGYREQLEDILTFTEGRRVLNLREVSRYTGMCWRTVRKRGLVEEGKKEISAVMLARKLVAL